MHSSVTVVPPSNGTCPQVLLLCLLVMVNILQCKRFTLKVIQSNTTLLSPNEGSCCQALVMLKHPSITVGTPRDDAHSHFTTLDSAT